MSNKEFKYEKLYRILEESIDYENSDSIPLKLNQIVETTIEGYNIGMMIENYKPKDIYKFDKGSILYNNFNPKTYYNFGYDVNKSTVQQVQTDYRVLSKVLGVVIKSLIEWIKNNNPEIITLFADSKSDKERIKKLSIYGSILQSRKDELKRLGYVYSGNMGGNLIVIQKYNA